MERSNGENITGKILALLLAVILWVYVMNEQNPPVEQSLNVKLDVRNVAQGLTLAEATETVKVRYRGPRSIIAGMHPQDLEVYVDARGLQEGEHALPVKASVPSSLELIEVVPNTATVRLESLISRQVPITPQFTGGTAPGIVIGKAGVTPVQATVSGPRGKVDAVSAVVVYIDIHNLDKDTNIEGALQAVGSSGTAVAGIHVSPDKAQVQITIQRGIVTKTVDIKPIVSGDLAPGAMITKIITEPDKLEIRGQADALKTINWLATAPIDVSGQYTDIIRETRVQLQEGVAVTKGDVVRVEIYISGSPARRAPM